MNTEIENDVEVIAIKNEAINNGVSEEAINEAIHNCNSKDCILKKIRTLISLQQTYKENQLIQEKFLEEKSESIPSEEEVLIIIENEAKRNFQSQTIKL